MSNRPAFRIRGETRLKNARLVEAREEMGMRSGEFAKYVGITPALYSGYENLRLYPGARIRKLLAQICGCSEEELFPEELKHYANGEEPRKFLQFAEIEPSRLIGSVRRQALLAPASDTSDGDLNKKELSDLIDSALRKIKPREAFVIRTYFGIGSEDPMTLDEIASILGITRQGVRHIREKALFKLRHRRIAQHLLEMVGN